MVHQFDGYNYLIRLDKGEQPVIHIHATLSDRNMQGFGGHVKEMEVAGTCEVLLHRWYGENLTRREDLATGLKTLNL